MKVNSQFDIKKLTEGSAKAVASTIEKFLTTKGIAVPHTTSLDLAGVLCGFENWQSLQAHVTRSPSIVEMNFDKFESRFKPRQNPFSRTGGPGFATKGQELDYVLKALETNPATVWTCTEGDDGGLYVGDGFHRVNTQFYLVTHKPAEAGVSYCIPWDHDLEDPAFNVKVKDNATGTIVFDCTVRADNLDQAASRGMEEAESEIEELLGEGGMPVMLVHPLD